MTAGKHILVISQYFYPEQFRINDICEEWIKRGHRVTVLTGIPNYPEGKYYKGYGLHKKRVENHCGITIIRIPIVPRGRNSLMLFLNYISFVISGFFWSMFTRVKADYVFIFEVSPMTQALPGIWYGKKKKIPCYLYVQDLWPDNVEIIMGIHNPFIIKPIEKMVEYIYRKSDMIFATSPSFVYEIVKRGVDKNKVRYWPQYAEAFYRPVCPGKRNKIFDDACFNIIFTGNVGKAQGLDILPRVAVLLKELNINFIIVGDGRYANVLKQEIAKHGLENRFIWLGRRKPEEIPELLALADAAFLSFMDTSVFDKTIPAKLQSYMACGIPVIASARGETKRVIESAGCGVCSPIGDEKALARAIRWMMVYDKRGEMGDNGVEYTKRNFNRKNLLDEMEQYFNECC